MEKSEEKKPMVRGSFFDILSFQFTRSQNELLRLSTPFVETHPICKFLIRGLICHDLSSFSKRTIHS